MLVDVGEITPTAAVVVTLQTATGNIDRDILRDVGKRIAIGCRWCGTIHRNVGDVVAVLKQIVGNRPDIAADENRGKVRATGERRLC